MRQVIDPKNIDASPVAQTPETSDAPPVIPILPAPDIPPTTPTPDIPPAAPTPDIDLPDGPPIVRASAGEAHVDAQITLKPLPPIGHSEANSCKIQCIVNDVKNAFIDGECDDAELKDWLADKQRFSFCMTHVIRHSDDGKLSIDFYVSHTETAPTWRTEQPVTILNFIGRKKKKGKKKPDEVITPMSADEVELMKSAFVRQCTRALSDYVKLVYERSCETGVEPDYYHGLATV